MEAQMDQGDERRILKRRHIMFYSRVFDRKTGKLLGYLGNLTHGGAMLISEEALELGSLFKLRMDLPEDMYDQPILTFEAKSVWCKTDIDPRFFNTGFEFTDITPENTNIVDQINDDYGFRD
jgi:hypothetical protein